MKKFDLPGAIVNSLLSICMGLAVAGCISSAFRLSYPDLPEILTCLYWAAIICWIFPLKKGWIAIPIGLALWMAVLWLGDASDQVGYLLRTYFTIYSQAYGIQVPGGLAQYTGPEVSLALSMISGSITLLCGLGLGRLKSGVLGICTSVIALLPCFVATDTVPHEAFLFLLLSCIALILLTQATRRHDPQHVAKLTCVLLLPVLLANICLFQCIPQQTYDKQPENLFSEEFWEEHFPKWTSPGTTGPSIQVSLGDVDLRSVGPKTKTKELVMEVDAPKLQGALYLRGKSYSSYDGLSWDAPVINDDSLQIIHQAYWASAATRLSIHTLSRENLLYAAYYPANRVSLRGGAFYNPSLETDYGMQIQPLRSDWRTLYCTVNPGMTVSSSQVFSSHLSTFLELPENTQKKAEKLLKKYGITDQTHVLTAVDTIVYTVQASADYSLATDFMPAGEKDFALWFLENSDTGYCVHFATAAAVLLRAAGIPTRYVEGYVTRIHADGTGRVTADQAHAWVECWLPELGWVAFEPTPSVGWYPPEDPEPTRPTTATRPTRPTETSWPATTAPTTTQPGQTQPSTLPTQPSSTPGADLPDDPKAELTWLWAALQSLLVVTMAGLALWGQQRLRLQLRRLWLTGGSPNTQALRRWRYTQHLAKLRQQDAPAALRELAQKAKFSQHTISAEELAAFDGYFDRTSAHLRRRNWLLRLYYRLILAIY